MTATRTLLVAAAFLFAQCAVPGGDAGRERKITDTTPWLCYYGDDPRVLEVGGYELLLLESEGVGDITAEDKAGRICVAYMSIGEAEMGRWFWPDIADEPWVLDVNPHWPESRLVDPRSDEWRVLVVDEIAASIMAAGYDGFILDNVDTAEMLLKRDPERYRGADKATADIIRGLRESYPDAVIIANGGLSIVPDVAESLDAMMYEGTVSTWKTLDNGEYGYGEIPAKSKTWLRPRLQRVKKAGLPILALEYVDPADAAERRRVWDMVVQAGNNPFISERALDTFPGSDTLPPRADD